MTTTTKLRTLSLGSILFATLPAFAQQDFSTVEIEAVPVADDLYMLVGSGGNIGLSVGDDGTVIVDTQFGPLSEKIQTAINRVRGGDDVKFVINTHWHGDHTGGNENFGKAGAVIIAHNNVRTRMSTEQVMAALNQTVPASPSIALPVLTFPTRATFHWNGNTVNVYHVDNAHTDGDSIVHFTNLNAFHMGDTFVNGGYPFIDNSSNGSIDGIIAAAEDVLARSDANTKIIPGHGPLATPDDLRAFLNVVKTTRDRIQTMIDQGRSEADVIAGKPTAEWDATYGGGFMNGETFTRFAYQDLKE
ncbi:MAG TPA: MBL fold metallo-hydrolase [Gammaproteobacteria bacterium]|nr:MBL fold metallo-hydrolase [Gammaproteobacteria bacterium]